MSLMDMPAARIAGSRKPMPAGRGPAASKPQNTLQPRKPVGEGERHKKKSSFRPGVVRKCLDQNIQAKELEAQPDLGAKKMLEARDLDRGHGGAKFGQESRVNWPGLLNGLDASESRLAAPSRSRRRTPTPTKRLKQSSRPGSPNPPRSRDSPEAHSGQDAPPRLQSHRPQEA